MNPFAWIAITTAVVAGLAGARVRWRDWGALPTELRLALPGDELINEPASVVTRVCPLKRHPRKSGNGWCRSDRTEAGCTATTGSRICLGSASTRPRRSAPTGSTSG